MNTLVLSLAISAALISSSSEPVQPIAETVRIEDNSKIFNITVEEYIAGVVAHEVPYTFEEEALKAQAIAARTYLYYCLENNSHPHEFGDVCTNPSHCCGYISEAELAARFGAQYASDAFEAARSAVKSTAAEILMYEQKPLLAVWHASSDGYTENSGDVWLSQLPYLCAVSSPESPESSYAVFSLTDVSKRLKKAGYSYNGGSYLQVSYTVSGRCAKLTLGNITLDGNTVRNIFGLKSTDFTAWIFGGQLHFIVRGYGHGVGMSQLGANTMAKKGQTYKDILAHYYPGSELTSFSLD